LQSVFQFGRTIVDKTVEWATGNLLWLSNILPDSMVVILFLALAGYSAIQLQYAI
jgi:hypothetical protein